MTAALALSGWLVAGVLAGSRWRLGRERARRARALARAAHELRGPLGALGLALALGRRAGGLAPRRCRALEGELQRAGLALADLEAALGGRSPQLRLEGVDVGGLLADSVEAWRASAARAGVTLDLHWSGRRARLAADPARLAQATGNLIANAIEHGGGRVQVRGTPWGEGARIEVADDGPGLAAPLPALTTEAGDGLRGHGLAVAAGVAAAHGGRLTTPDPGPARQVRGACLVLELPGAGPVRPAR